MKHHRKYVLPRAQIAYVVLIAFLGACSNYEYRLNERVVYTPAPLLSDVAVTDSALHDCLLQTINDLKVTRAQDLTDLHCSHAGIASLEGLQQFSALEWLDLSHNNLSDISPLQALTKVQVLDIAHNQVQDIRTLAFLPRLERADLSENADIDCRQANQLASANDVQLILPAYCQHNH